MWRKQEQEAELEGEQSRSNLAEVLERLEGFDLNSAQQPTLDPTQPSLCLPPQPEGFQFVNIVTLDEINNPKTKRFVRQQVWKHRKKEVKRATPRSLVAKPNPNTFLNTENLGMIRQQTTSPRSMISYNIVNSTIFPVPMNPELHRLVDLEHQPRFDSAASFRPVWFSMILQDEASFFQHMSTVRYHYGKLHGESEDAAVGYASVYYSRAVQSVNKRLADSVRCTTDQIIGAIICFLTHNHIIGEKEAYTMHKSGLARMISMRGGIKSLDGNYNLRLMLLWDEVCGACAFDIQPLYPVPWHFIPTFQKNQPLMASVLSRTTHTWEVEHGDGGEVLDIIEDMQIMNAMVQLREHDAWRDQMFLGLYVNPLIHRLLSIGQISYTISLSASRMVEACKLAGLLYMGKVRQRFMIYHVTGPHFEQRLYGLLDGGSIDWKLFKELEVWVLMTFLVNAVFPEKKAFIGRLARLVEDLSLTWDGLVDIVHGFVWLDSVVLEEMRNLKRDLERSLAWQGNKSE